MQTVLIVDDVEDYLRSLANALSGDFIVKAASSLAVAKTAMGDDVDVALVDVRLSDVDETNRDGLVLLEWLRAEYPEAPVIVMSAYRDFDVAVEALNLGAACFLRKPIELRELRGLLEALATNTGQLRRQPGSQE